MRHCWQDNRLRDSIAASESPAIEQSQTSTFFEMAQSRPLTKPSPSRAWRRFFFVRLAFVSFISRRAQAHGSAPTNRGLGRKWGVELENHRHACEDQMRNMSRDRQVSVVWSYRYRRSVWSAQNGDLAAATPL